MNTGAIVLLVAVLLFVAIESVALVRDLIKRRKNKKQKQSESSGGAPPDDNNNIGGKDDDRCANNAKRD